MIGAAPRDLRLVPAAVAGWAAAFVLIGIRDGGALWLVAMGLWCATAVGVVVARRRRWIAVIALALAASSLVTTAAAAATPVREPAEILTRAEGSRSAEVSAVVTGRPVGGRVRATVLVVDGVGGYGVPVLLFGDAPGSGIGDLLTARVSFVRAEAGDEVAFLAFARDDLRIDRRADGVLAGAEELRDRFATVAAGLPPPGAGLLPGLAIGDTSAVGHDLEADMKTSSLSHLTAVSGSNCAVVVGLVFAVAAGAGLSRWARVGVALVALAGFVILVTPEPSVVRAAAMAAIALGALAVSRPGRGIPLLCLAVLGLLALDPWLARSFGFALSVLATAGLLCLAAPLARVFGRVVPSWIALVLAVPLAAQLACQPVLLLLDPALPLYGVIANVLAEPAAPIATVLGLVACLLATLAPPLALPIAWIAWLPAAWIAAVARFTADLPGARSPWPVGPVGVALLVVVSLAAVVIVLRAGPRRLLVVARSLLLIAVVGYVATVAGNRVVTDLGRPGDWQIALCDIGQGDAAVVRDSGVVALIDTGPEPARLTACLQQLGVDRVQLLVLTHYDLHQPHIPARNRVPLVV